MKVYELIDILSKVDPDASIYVQDDEYDNISDSTFADIAPGGSVFIHYHDWYMQLLEDRGYLKRPTSVNEAKQEKEEDTQKDEEIYCTECPYFKDIVDEDRDWFGAKCEKDGHESSPSMYAIRSLHNDCPLKKEE